MCFVEAQLGSSSEDQVGYTGIKIALESNRPAKLLPLRYRLLVRRNIYEFSKTSSGEQEGKQRLIYLRSHVLFPHKTFKSASSTATYQAT